MPYVNQRWLGGVLTNFQTISLRIKRLHDLERYQAEGQLELLPTQERMKALADLAKLQANLGGVKNMQRPPDAMFVIDLKTEDIAVKEAKRLRIPIIGLVDTNCDPDGIQYVIPGNDDAMKSCAVITGALGDVIRDGRAAWQHVEEERVRKEAEEAARKARPRRPPSARPRSRPAPRPRPPRRPPQAERVEERQAEAVGEPQGARRRCERGGDGTAVRTRRRRSTRTCRPSPARAARRREARRPSPRRSRRPKPAAKPEPAAAEEAPTPAGREGAGARRPRSRARGRGPPGRGARRPRPADDPCRGDDRDG